MSPVVGVKGSTTLLWPITCFWMPQEVQSCSPTSFSWPRSWDRQIQEPDESSVQIEAAASKDAAAKTRPSEVHPKFRIVRSWTPEFVTGTCSTVTCWTFEWRGLEIRSIEARAFLYSASSGSSVSFKTTDWIFTCQWAPFLAVVSLSISIQPCCSLTISKSVFLHNCLIEMFGAATRQTTQASHVLATLLRAPKKQSHILRTL